MTTAFKSTGVYPTLTGEPEGLHLTILSGKQEDFPVAYLYVLFYFVSFTSMSSTRKRNEFSFVKIVTKIIKSNLKTVASEECSSKRSCK